MPEAIPVFDDPYAITIRDDESNPIEQRFVTLGMGALGRLLVVVYTWRATTFASSPRALLKPMSVRDARQNNEGPIRFQQRQARAGSPTGV